MRYVIVLLLCGCAWGQDLTWICTPSSGEAHCKFEPKPGDCLYVQADGNLRKVDFCTNTFPIQPKRETGPKDIPATRKHEMFYCGKGNYTYCDDGRNSSNAATCVYDAMAKEIEANCAKPHCSDPDRILIGPDGHGKYWCHLPQTEAK